MHSLSAPSLAPDVEQLVERAAGGATGSGGGSSGPREAPEVTKARTGEMRPGETVGAPVTDTVTGTDLGFSSFSG